MKEEEEQEEQEEIKQVNIKPEDARNINYSLNII
jgi:hypothetical protein